MSAGGTLAEEPAVDRVLRLILETDPELLANPWPLWDDLREQAPVVEAGPMFLVTRHALVKEVQRDAVRFSNDSRRRGSRAEAIKESLTPERRAAWQEIMDFHGLWMQGADDPMHSRLRNIAIRAFTPARIRELADNMRMYVDEVIESMAGQDEVDLMNLALDIPLMIITDMLGVPPADRELVKGFSRKWFEFQFVKDDRIFISVEAQRGLQAYVDGMIDEHRRNPDRTTLVAALIGAEHDERLTAPELAALFFLLLFAGHETTTNLIATGMMELLSRPEQWRALVDDPGLVPHAVEEMLRYVSPVQFLTRFTLEDLELEGTPIPAGATVSTMLAAANRDPRVFAEPESFDIRRTDANDHMAFGFGPHYCLGASLSRIEGTIAVEALARRLPDLELATDTFEWRGGATLRGLAALPVAPGRLRS